MPWKDLTTMSQRYELVRLYGEGQTSMTALCERFGVSRKTGHKWVNAYRAGGLTALADASRRPPTSPTRTPPEVEAQVLALAAAHPTWGGDKLHHRLRAVGLPAPPAPSTITAILRRAGRLRATPGGRAFTRFEHPTPNALWQVDFKGTRAQPLGRLHPLSVLDDHSRYLLGLTALPDQRHATVQAALTACFRTYGLPWAILADNGPPWGTSEPHARTRLDVWLMRLGIRVIHGRPLHPQTQGKVERFHRTLETDLLAGRTFRDLTTAQAAFDAFRQVYNHERPHRAVPDCQPPGAVYTLSPRPFPETLPEPAYGAEAAVRVVTPGGVIRYQRRGLRVGKGLAGMRIGVYPTATDGIVRLQFFATTLGEVDLRTLDPR